MLFILNRKAVKATAILFPLLGMTNLIYIIEYQEGESERAFRLTNAVLQSLQVSVLTNINKTEIQTIVLVRQNVPMSAMLTDGARLY